MKLTANDENDESMMWNSINGYESDKQMMMKVIPGDENMNDLVLVMIEKCLVWNLFSYFKLTGRPSFSMTRKRKLY